MTKKSINDLKPDDIVKSCKYLEKGCCVQLSGIHCCVHGSKGSPVIATVDEIKSGIVDYDFIVNRKKELFESINGFNDKDIKGCKDCCNIITKKFKDVSFDAIGGEHLPGGFNIQHYTECNERCLYCCYAQENNFKKPEYDILKIFDLFKNKNKLGKNNWIDFSGGEPAMLKDFDRIINYMLDNEMGTIVVYSNSVIYSKAISRGLKENKIILTTSLDTGIKSTYAKLRGADVYTKVIENLIKYKNTGTNGLWLKYVITEHNRTEDDMWSFIMTMLAIRPNKVMICPDFPYGDKEIPDETVKFAAKLWYLLEKYGNFSVQDYTSEMGDPKFAKYHKELAEEILSLKKLKPLQEENVLKEKRVYITEIKECAPRKKVTFLQKLFSIINEENHKVIRILGIKIKLRKGK